MKMCSSCKIKKPLSEYHLKGRLTNGGLKYHSQCKSCVKKAYRKTQAKKNRRKKFDIENLSVSIWVPEDPSPAKIKKLLRSFIEGVCCV